MGCSATVQLNVRCPSTLHPVHTFSVHLQWSVQICVKIATMSALQDPVDGSPAVLVKRYNITHQKELEIQLLNQQEALQRCVALLEFGPC